MSTEASPEVDVTADNEPEIHAPTSVKGKICLLVSSVLLIAGIASMIPFKDLGWWLYEIAPHILKAVGITGGLITLFWLVIRFELFAKVMLISIGVLLIGAGWYFCVTGVPDIGQIVSLTTASLTIFGSIAFSVCTAIHLGRNNKFKEFVTMLLLTNIVALCVAAFVSAFLAEQGREPRQAAIESYKKHAPATVDSPQVITVDGRVYDCWNAANGEPWCRLKDK